MVNLTILIKMVTLMNVTLLWEEFLEKQVLKYSQRTMLKLLMVL